MNNLEKYKYVMIHMKGIEQKLNLSNVMVVKKVAEWNEYTFTYN